MADKLQDRGFLQRWSERKHATREGGDLEEPQEDATAPLQQDLTGRTDPSELDSQSQEVQRPADLPNLEDLDETSDYSAFLGDGVPQDIAKMALRKLWRSDPVLANVDGLNDYDGDFSKVGMISEAVKTVYQVGKGYLDTDAAEIEDLPEDEAPTEALSDHHDDLEDQADGDAEQALTESQMDAMDDGADRSQTIQDSEAGFDRES